MQLRGASSFPIIADDSTMHCEKHIHLSTLATNISVTPPGVTETLSDVTETLWRTHRDPVAGHRDLFGADGSGDESLQSCARAECIDSAPGTDCDAADVFIGAQAGSGGAGGRGDGGVGLWGA